MKDVGLVIMLNAVFGRLMVGEAETIAEDVFVWVTIAVMAVGVWCYLYGSATEAQP